jgi:hypothetical protein
MARHCARQYCSPPLCSSKRQFLRSSLICNAQRWRSGRTQHNINIFLSSLKVVRLPTGSPNPTMGRIFLTGGASEKCQPNILRINKNGVIYFGLLLLQSTYTSLLDAAAAPFCPAGEKNRLGKLPLPCAFPSLSLSQPNRRSPTFRVLSFRISIKSFPFLLKHTLARSSLWGSSRWRAYATGCAPVPSVLHGERPSALCRWCSRSLAFASIHSLACIQYLCSQSVRYCRFFSLRRRALVGFHMQFQYLFQRFLLRMEIYAL